MQLSNLLLITGTGLTGLAVGTAVTWWQARRHIRHARMEADQVAEILRARLERPSVFSHEVRTPLALIKGATELLAEQTPGPLNERQREFVTTIATNAEHVIGMAEDLLTEARMANRLFRLDTSEFDLHLLVRETVHSLRRIHGAPLRIVGQGRPLLVRADRGLIRQAFFNVINNAARHAGPGVTITVEVTGGLDEVVIAISDDGAGMTEKERAALFEPFATDSAHRGGTGLGMMITESILREHGGRVLVDTVDEHGTTVFITLPTNAQEDQ
ncbi:His Kinase A (phospho-acceptor) domain-containing protein [Austwickia chelonae]|uniref:histidine kinase n=1 Tax=Austwickia chelonae NBRC 105200 TaxID=1184607 RepID=K6VA58_9MICO|nr:HAMP domain-containing sensor histidine kinase [Austwickia chelonae]GAB79113.1 putative two-component histidine kinase [Austwickia chelonae NBRC 105200]SEW42363.1 His Kinase A (phospho-acceptor) domain-containing protein [Austwickia chelonae]